LLILLVAIPTVSHPFPAFGFRELAVQPADSAGSVRKDSLLADTTRTDSTRAVSNPSGVDSVVTYAASDSILYFTSDRTMHLYGKGDIKYKELGLKAAKIDVNWNTTVLNAEGVPDPSDSTGKKFKGLPVLKEGTEEYNGLVISYNFKSKKGKIDLGKTQMDKGYYYGDEIKKVEDKAMFVEDGKYTTCDLEHPHYYFYSPEMKVMLGDKIVARPITLEIADVPVFALPFGIFPTERGRRSGLIAPAYGESSLRGRYITHLGYYWAISDYMDMNFLGDGYAKGGYTFSSNFRYALRYQFTGSLSGSYGRTIYGERGDPGYGNSSVFNVNWTHSQEFDPTLRLLVDFTFMTGSFYQQTSNNLNDLLRQNVVSNATLTKYWEGTPNSMTVNVHRDQNLRPTPGTIEISQILPSVSFNRSQSFPFRSGKNGSLSSNPSFFELIGYTYGGQFEDVKNTTYLDTLGNRNTDERWGAQHSITVNASPKAGYFTITPYFNFTSKWYGKTVKQSFTPGSGVTTEDVNGFSTVNYFDMGVSMSTKLYGLVRPNVLGIVGIRHQMTPSIGYVYQPDFSASKWHYYGSYVDTFGVTQKYSFHQNGIFGGAPSEERQALTFSLGNVFEMKTAGDSVGKENKFTLLNLNLSTGYNFARDSLRFDEIGMNFRTAIGQYLSISGSGSFNLYKFDVDPVTSVGRRVNKFLLNEGRIADMTNFSFSLGTRFSGEKKQTSAGPVKSEGDSLRNAEKRGYVGLYDQTAPDFSIPWNIDLNWNFSESKADPRTPYRSSSISISLGFNLTELWKMSGSFSYDLLNKQVAAPQITVYRDLHCWEMNFSWVPTGYYRNFKLEIRLKAPQLQDIKVTKQGSAREVY
jgi:lipopolysaccharide assembly outer membrane protein LptD (OstA)